MIAMDTATTAPATLDLGVAGMTCASCVSRVERALKKVPGVSDAVVNLATESARVTFAPSEQAEAQIRRPCAMPATSRARSRSARRKTSPPGPASRRWRSACCCRCRWCCPCSASCRQHWMLPAWLQFLLATPVQFVLGARFYKAGWHALKAGTGNMDLLVAIGTTAGWGLSMWMWLAQAAATCISDLGRGGDAGAAGQVAGGAGQAADHRGHPCAAGLAAGDRARDPARGRRGRPAAGRGDGGRPAGGAPGRTRAGRRHAGAGRHPHRRIHADGRAAAGFQVGRRARHRRQHQRRRPLRDAATAVGSERARADHPAGGGCGPKAPIQRMVDQVSAVFVPVVLGIAAITLAGWLFAGAGVEADPRGGGAGDRLSLCWAWPRRRPSWPAPAWRPGTAS